MCIVRATVLPAVSSQIIELAVVEHPNYRASDHNINLGSLSLEVLNLSPNLQAAEMAQNPVFAVPPSADLVLVL